VTRPPLELLERLRASESPPGTPMAEQRRAYVTSLRARFGPVRELRRVSDAVVRTSEHVVPVRRYEPFDAVSGACVVYMHGGGWAFGDLDSHDGLCRELAARSRVRLVSVDYRLAPEHPYPAALDDAWAVLDAATETKVLVAGDSAGANLAAGLALRARDSARPLAGQLLLYPALDHRCTGASFDAHPPLPPEREAMRDYWRAYLGDLVAGAAPGYAAPATVANLAGVARALVITAEWDPLRDEGCRYVSALRDCGVPSEHVDAAEMIHGFLVIPELSAWEAVITTCASFIARAADPARTRGSI
jgi:acetyl esterase